jgi:zinc transport system ATP-binding protein
MPIHDGRMLLDARRLGVRLGGREIVRGIDVAVARGEVVTLVGPNGGGKSTIVKALLGLVPAAAGSVTRARGLRVGYVPQRLEIDRTLPIAVERFMRLTARLSEAALAAALAAVNGAHLAGRMMTALSGGELQRVMLARAIAVEPDVLVLDEPAQGIDFVGEIAIYDLIDRVRRERDLGVLMVSHDLHVVMARTDRVLCINGHVCCAGTPQAVSADSEYHRLFGPRAAAVLALYPHDHDHHHGMPMQRPAAATPAAAAPAARPSLEDAAPAPAPVSRSADAG